MDDLRLRRLVRTDFALLATWLAAPHVARWWDHETTPTAIERDFGSCVDGTEPTEVFVAEVGGRPVGLVQRHAFADYPEWRDEMATLVDVPEGAWSVDYFVGEADVLRRGIGAAMVREAVHSHWAAHPRATAVIVAVSAANTASWRMLESAGFSRIATGNMTPDNPIDDTAHVVYRLDRPRDAGGFPT
jgi:aminoglycoside 6'-N-acetyltransferase